MFEVFKTWTGRNETDTTEILNEPHGKKLSDEPRGKAIFDLKRKEPHYSFTSQINHVLIQPRDQDTASTRVVDLTKLTSKDVICWYYRDLRFAGLPNKHVRHEKNKEFSRKTPLGYQWTRVGIDEGGMIDELSRECLCMFCQRPKFYPLTGMNSLLRHFELYHPHEVPDFVQILLSELGLGPKMEPRIVPKFQGTSLYDWYKGRNQLHYRLDGFSNQLKFAPREKTTLTSMLLSEVSEKNVMPYFHRDIEDFRRYPHPIAWYDENTAFDPAHPRGSQIIRIILDSNRNEVHHLKQFLCLFCQEPTFLSFGGCGNLIGHVAWEHWGQDMVSHETLVKLYHLSPKRLKGGECETEFY